MWRAHARCRAARAKLSAPCTRDMLWAFSAAAQQGAFGERTETLGRHHHAIFTMTSTGMARHG